MFLIDRKIRELIKNSFMNAYPTLEVPILSFFTGAGFLDIGFMEAGFKNIVWRNEFNSEFTKSFEYGMSCLDCLPNCKINNQKSIVDIELKEIEKEAFANTGIPDFFGIIGCPPCPDFSMGGKNKGKKGDNGKLSQVYVDLIISLNPTFFIFENVWGLVRTEKHKSFFYEIQEQLKEAGYCLSYRVLNALDFGVPQNRNRVFMVGFRQKWLMENFDSFIDPKDGSWFPWPIGIYPDAKNKFSWPKGTNELGSTPPKPVGIPDELMVGLCISIDNPDTIASLPNGQEGFKPKSEKFKFIREGDDSRKSFKRLHRWRYSPSVAYGNNEVHLHPFLPRRLTVREAMRIQTVPDEYAFPPDVSLSDKFKMISNGVPVNLAAAVAESIAKVLRGELNESSLAGSRKIIVESQQLCLFDGSPLK